LQPVKPLVQRAMLPELPARLLALLLLAMGSDLLRVRFPELIPTLNVSR